MTNDNLILLEENNNVYNSVTYMSLLKSKKIKNQL